MKRRGARTFMGFFYRVAGSIGQHKKNEQETECYRVYDIVTRTGMFLVSASEDLTKLPKPC